MTLVVASIFDEGHFEAVLKRVQRDILEKDMAPMACYNCTMHQALGLLILKREEIASAGCSAEGLLHLTPTRWSPPTIENAQGQRGQDTND